MMWSKEAVYRILRFADKNPSHLGLDDLPDDAAYPGTESVDLVCAAPDLYEALRSCLDGLKDIQEDGQPHGVTVGWLVEHVEAALRKARGEK